MKRMIPVFLSLLAAFSCTGTLCDISSHNGPVNFNPVDTMQVKHLDTVRQINLIVVVNEFDKNTQKHSQSLGANVHFFNSDTNVTTDSSGYASAFFLIDSIPFQYRYEITKDGYKKLTFENRSDASEIKENITIYKN